MATQAQWVDHNVAGMFGPPSNTVNPQLGARTPFGFHDHVVPLMPNWDWKLGARIGRWTNVAEGSATAVNGVLGHVSGSLDYKVEVRNMEVWLLTFGVWSRKYTTAGRDAAAIYGSYKRVQDYSHVGGITEEVGPAGGCMFPLREFQWAHFYCQGNGPRVTLLNGTTRLHFRMEMRLVGNARNSAVVVGRVGADTFTSATQGAPANVIQPSIFIARHKVVTSEWRWFVAGNMYENELRGSPGAPPQPANWSAGGTIPDPEPEPEPDSGFLSIAPSTIIQ